MPVFNIGNPKESTILELAENVLCLIPESKSKLVYKDIPKDDPRQRNPDIAFAKKVLGWDPTIKLEEGLNRTIDYFRGIQ